MSDLIDREVLSYAVNTIKIDLETETFYSLYQKVLKVICEVPSVQLEDRWVPCSKKLPEDGIYLVYAPDYQGGSSRTKECHDGVMFSKYKNGKWSIEHGYYERPNCVKAWMSMPQPFLEGDTENE